MYAHRIAYCYKYLGSFDTYLWSTGEATSSIYVKQSGSYSVDVTSGACKLSASQAIEAIRVTLTVTASAASLPHLKLDRPLN